MQKIDGLKILEMIRNNELKVNSILRTENENECIYYKYCDDKKIHRCDETGKLGIKNQVRFLQYETLDKEFVIKNPGLQIGDKITYKGLSWFISRIIYDHDKKYYELFLAEPMSNKILKQIFDNEYLDNSDSKYVLFDKKSYDWAESYIRKQLNSKFLEVLEINKSDLLKMKTNYKQDSTVDDYVRIPSFKDMNELPKEIIKRNYFYYLMNKGVYREDCDNYKAGNDHLLGVFGFNNNGGYACSDISFRVVLPIIQLDSLALESKED